MDEELKEVENETAPQLDLLRAEIKGLAALDEMEYAAARRDAAKRLKFKVAFLDQEVAKEKSRRAKERRDEFIQRKGGPPPGYKQVGNYRQTPEGIFLHDPTYGERQLTNFTAEILADIVVDNGAETTRHVSLAAELGKHQSTFEIPAKEFDAMRWVAEFVGATAIIHPGKFAIEHTATAIKMLSLNVREDTDTPTPGGAP